jgi:hypothetical protein
VKRALAPLAAAALLAACGSEGSPEQAQQDGGDPPKVAELVCRADGPELLTPVVRGQHDGVHVRVRNETDHEVDFDFEVTRGDTGGGGAVAPPGTSVQVVSFAAKELSIGCVAEALDRVELHVVGEELKATDLQCEELQSHDVEPAAGRRARDPAAVARWYLRGRGLRQTDVVERAVSIGGEFPVARVVRRGRVVAKVVVDAGGPPTAFATVEMCADFAE